MSNKYECKICGFIYDPEEGDPDNICGASKIDFEPLD
jgi:rubredoxin